MASRIDKDLEKIASGKILMPMSIEPSFLDKLKYRFSRRGREEVKAGKLAKRGYLYEAADRYFNLARQETNFDHKDYLLERAHQLSAERDRLKNEGVDSDLTRDIKAYRVKAQKKRFEYYDAEWSHTAAIISGAVLVASIFFSSIGITGNVIGSLSNPLSRVIGAILFLVGIVLAFLCFKRK
jgi:hypothetical protein